LRRDTATASNSKFGHKLTAAAPLRRRLGAARLATFFKGFLKPQLSSPARGAQHPRAGERLTHRGGKIWSKETTLFWLKLKFQITANMTNPVAKGAASG
jgi:hypothetical protein